MSRYTRHQSVVSRQADEPIEEDHWLKQFQRTLQKGAVQPKTQQSLFDQISSIMNGSKSRYSSVEDAVKDMQERSGLTAYLNKKISKEDQQSANTKTASSDEQPALDKKVEMTPIVVRKHPPVMKTLENYIRDTRGNLPIPAIIEKIKSIHKADCSDAKDWDDEKLIRLVSKLNLNAKKNNPASYENFSHLGERDTGSESEIDPSNVDAFHALSPAKI